MSFSKLSPVPASTLPSSVLAKARRLLAGRRGLIALAAIALLLGTILGWSWLVAIGVAPLLLGLLPCAAMCALGLCMNRMSHRADAGKTTDGAAPSGASPGQPAASETAPPVASSRE